MSLFSSKPPRERSIVPAAKSPRAIVLEPALLWAAGSTLLLIILAIWSFFAGVAWQHKIERAREVRELLGPEAAAQWLKDHP